LFPSKVRGQNALARRHGTRQNVTVFTYKGFDHIALVTRHLAAMKKFYSEGLGLPVESEGKAKAGYQVVTLRAGDAVLDLFEASPINPAPSANLSEEHFCLRANGSIYDVIATLKRKGLDPTQAEVNNGAAGKGLSIFVRDPDGNKVEIKVD
jgi:glyoxylase I family protein